MLTAVGCAVNWVAGAEALATETQRHREALEWRSAWILIESGSMMLGARQAWSPSERTLQGSWPRIGNVRDRSVAVLRVSVPLWLT